MIAVDTDRERCAEVFALRCVCWQNGYRPLAIYSPGAKFRGEPIEGAGKRPVTTDWLKQALQDTPLGSSGIHAVCRRWRSTPGS